MAQYHKNYIQLAANDTIASKLGYIIVYRVLSLNLLLAVRCMDMDASISDTVNIESL